MASESPHCPDCHIYFDSQQSLEVHLQYHKENLMSMWMGTDVKREPGTESGDANQPHNSNSGASSTVAAGSIIHSSFVKSEPKESNESEPSFIGPPPISPMDYEFKVEPPMHSPRNNLISPGPSSNSTLPSYAQSTGSYYSDFNTQHLVNQANQQQMSFQNYSTNYQNGVYDDQYFNRGGSSRFHPYIGRSPVPTPSPGTTHDVKEERLTPGTPEILDLDSQKVLNSTVPTSNQMGALPPMWRPHEQFNSQTNGVSPAGLTVPSPNVNAVGSSPTANNLGSSSSNSAPGTIGLPSNMNMSPSMGGQLNMPPPIQQSFSVQHSLNPQARQIISPGTAPSGFSPNSTLTPFYNQSHPVSSSMTNNSQVQFTSNQATSPSAGNGPPTEYPANVKRAKSFKCEDCNKWFTSHGHLKRHYNTTLHKNMTKLNNPTNNTPPTAPDVIRTPIVSPSSTTSIPESPSNHDEEVSIQNTKPIEPSLNFPHAPSAFQPLNNTNNFSGQTPIYPGHTSHTSISLGHHNPGLPQYSQAHSFPAEQPLTAPTMYHGHFSANPASYAPQPSVPSSGHFFLANNYFYPQQGGLNGPGFHSMNEFPGPNSVDGFNSLRQDNHDHHNSILNGMDSRISPDSVGDTGSEASMDSSESSISTVLPDSAYKCNDCHKTFNRMCYLTQHRSTYHEGEKPFKCGVCGKRFTDETIFTDHQGKHAGEKPYKCEVCPKQFNHKTDLRRHMCLHTGEKPFACEQCGKGFIRKDHMLKHFQTHRKKAIAAAGNGVSHHPTMPPNHPNFVAHRTLPPQHGPLPHPGHGPRNHPRIVAPPVY